ncbi:MAG: VWA domain-containing protein [Phycisphaeraceae bacterium]|nr:MAG: VWA domain-containing protein [Phycisphaeraceae bacterium]
MEKVRLRAARLRPCSGRDAPARWDLYESRTHPLTHSPTHPLTHSPLTAHPSPIHLLIPASYTSAMGLSFEQPLWLLLILLAIPLGWLALRWFHTMSRARAWSSVVLRALLIALIAGMLAGASAVRTTERLAVIALIDVSDSARSFVDYGTDSEGRPLTSVQWMRDWLMQATQDRRHEDLFGLIAFDGAAAALLTPFPPGVSGDFTLQDAPLDVRMVEGTNIAEAIRLASAVAPPDAARRFVLISDGNQTAGDALAAAREASGGGGAASRAGTPIDVVPLSFNIRREVMIEFLDAPPQAQSESTVMVRIGMRAIGPASGTLFLSREGERIDLSPGRPSAGRRLELEPGRHVELVEVKLDERTLHRFEAVFEPDDPAMDTVLANNRAEAFTVTPGRGSVLIVDGAGEGDPDGPGRFLAGALQRAGLEVEMVHPAAAPSDLLSLHAYDLVILNNVGADELPRRTQSLLADYVNRLGGGLVMAGGPASFGAGGWRGSPIEPILPVGLEIPEQLIKPSAAIMIVLDTSGSMAMRVLGGMRTQQEIANEAAALAIESLDPQDLVGVLEFNHVQREVVPLGPNSNPQDAADRVRRLTPGGGTDLYPALDYAGRQLEGVDANVRHVIVLSDGVSRGDPNYGFSIAERLSAQGITVTTIAVGDMADVPTLQGIADAGGGKFHRVLDPYGLPRIFINEIRVIRRPLVREGLFTPVVPASGSPLMAGVPRQWPQLRGVVLTQEREEPTITYAAYTSEGEPLLAHWNVGLGQVAAFTSDTYDWARPWLEGGWEGFAALWTQVARSVSRPTTAGATQLSTEVVDDRLRIRYEALDDDGAPLDMLTVPGAVYAPDDATPRDIRLSQTGPGLYETTIDAEASGNYIIALTPRQGGQAMPPVIGGVSRSIGAEFRRLQSDIGFLSRIAEETGGRVLDSDRPERADLFNRADLQPVRAATPIWRTLMIWCLLVLLLDVATRRVAWDRLVTREVADEWRRQATGALQQRSAAAAETASRLRGVTRTARGESGARDSEGQASPAAPRRERDRSIPVVPATTQASGRPNQTDVEMERQRRQTVRDALRAASGQGGSERKAEKPALKSEKPPDAGGASSLLDAKRRARERYSGEDGLDGRS